MGTITTLIIYTSYGDVNVAILKIVAIYILIALIFLSVVATSINRIDHDVI